MKILHVAPLYLSFSGGAETHLRQVSERLAARGHDVMVLTTNSKSEADLAREVEFSFPSFENVNGVQILRVSVRRSVFAKFTDFLSHRVPGGYRFLTSLFSPSELELLRRSPRNFGFFWKILQSNVDLVVSWNWFWAPAYYTYLAGRIRSIPLVAVPLFHTAEQWSEREIYKKMLTRCKGHIVNTSHEKEFILNLVPTIKRITVAGVGIEPEKFRFGNGAAFRKEHEIGSGPLIGFIGRIAVNKGVVKVVEAMSEVWKWNRSAKLVIAGVRSNPVPELEMVLKQFTPDERKAIIFLYNFSEEEKVDLYRAIDVLVLPSISESFGIAYLEAWMCRKPVIGARIPSTACVIDEEVDGLLVEPNDCKEIAGAIIELLSNPERMIQMGSHGYEKTMKNYTWEKVTDQFETTCLEVVSSPRS